MDIASLLRDIPDFPKPGIVFKDITPLLADPRGLAVVVDRLAEPWIGQGIDRVVGIESRGFIFAPAVALRLDCGFVPVRKPGKLPYRTRRIEYQLEYGTDTLEIHDDALAEGDRVLVVDDVLATGGTARATCELVAGFGAAVASACFIVELGFLGGRQRLDAEIQSLLVID